MFVIVVCMVITMNKSELFRASLNHCVIRKLCRVYVNIEFCMHAFFSCYLKLYKGACNQIRRDRRWVVLVHLFMWGSLYCLKGVEYVISRL